MSVLQLLDDVQKTGAKLHLVRNELRIRAPRGALDLSLKTRINAHKSELVEHLRKMDTATDFLQHASSERPDRLPLSFAQERLWFLDKLQPGGTEYNMAAASRFRSEFRAEAFERAIQELVRRHETLRTRFAHQAGEPMLVIDPPNRVVWSGSNFVAINIFYRDMCYTEYKQVQSISLTEILSECFLLETSVRFQV